MKEIHVDINFPGDDFIIGQMIIIVIIIIKNADCCDNFMFETVAINL